MDVSNDPGPSYRLISKQVHIRLSKAVIDILTHEPF